MSSREQLGKEIDVARGLLGGEIDACLEALATQIALCRERIALSPVGSERAKELQDEIDSCLDARLMILEADRRFGDSLPTLEQESPLSDGTDLPIGSIPLSPEPQLSER